MKSENLNLFMDMTQLMLRAVDKLHQDGSLTEKERNAIKNNLGTIKNVLYNKEAFKDIYLRYCKDSVRLIG